jgi:putative hydrolase of the HAD superfamily
LYDNKSLDIYTSINKRHSQAELVNSIIDTILFDLDDTLIIERKSAEESFVETIQQINLPIKIDEFLKTVRNEAKEQWHKLPTIDFCLKIGISSWEALWADFTGADGEFIQLRRLADGYRFDTWNQTLIKLNIHDEDLANRLSSDFKRIRGSKHVLFPETINTLSKLKKKYKLGLITNGAPDIQWKKINGGNLKHFFDYIAISGEHGYAKPDSRLFDIAIKGLESAKINTIMVGDTIKTDIQGGNAYGLTTIWVNRNGNKVDEIKPDYEVKKLTDIYEIIITPLDMRHF